MRMVKAIGFMNLARYEIFMEEEHIKQSLIFILFFIDPIITN